MPLWANETTDTGREVVMAATEFVTENNSETELTCTPLTSDQPTVSPTAETVTTDTPSPTAMCHSQPVRTHTPPTTQDTHPQTAQNTTETEKQCDVILDSCSSPQVCQQVEIVTEEQRSESQLLQIDAVWSIGQEHSYEQRPWKYSCNDTQNFHAHTDKAVHLDEEDDTDANSTPDNLPEKGSHSQSVEIQHIPVLSCSDDNEQEPVKTYVIHNPQILKIQTKAKKRYVIQNSSNPNETPASCGTVHGLKAHSLSKKTYRTLKLPHSSNSQSSCLIDHNLKPLQIQHNLMHNDKSSLALLKLEKVGLKHHHHSKESSHFSFATDPQTCPTHTLPVRRHRERFTVKESGTSDMEDDEEVGTDAVYLDVDQEPSLEFGENGQMLSTDGAVRDSPMLDQCGANISMDQYLPDISDLPQFHNIPPDGQDDQCDEPAHLTPSIDHSVLDYSNCWPHADHLCYSYTSTAATVSKPHHANTATSCHPYLGDLCQATGPLGDMQSAHTPPSVQCNLTLTQLSAATATTSSGTVTAPMAINIKTEGPWQQVEDSDHTPDAAPGQPAQGDNLAMHPHNPISTALMAAFDLDSHSSHLVERQSCIQMDPVPHPSYSYENSGLAMGCSSTFLSPPASVEQQTSQRSTPCVDNESGYMTMEEQDLQSPAMLWPQHQPYPTTITHSTDTAYNHHPNPAHYPPGDCGYGEGGGYPYTHQDSHHQTLHQTASCSLATPTPCTHNDIIYYPFNDLMQLNPGLTSSDQDMSIQYVQPGPYNQHSYGQQLVSDSLPDQPPTQPFQHKPPSTRKRGRGGRARGGRHSQLSQIQSDHITSSLQRQLQAQVETPAKRQYRRRNGEGRRRPAGPAEAGTSNDGNSSVEHGEKKVRHNEPLNQKAVDIMFEWYQLHEDNPYPSKEDKEHMSMAGGITTMQVKSWFANKRNRSNNTRPKVQKRAMEKKLMQIYNRLSKTECTSAQNGSNSFIIKELSQIIHNKLESEMPGTPESDK